MKKTCTPHFEKQYSQFQIKTSQTKIDFSILANPI